MWTLKNRWFFKRNSFIRHLQRGPEATRKRPGVRGTHRVLFFQIDMHDSSFLRR